MGEDFVLECVKNGTSKEDIENTVHLSWNIAKSETEKVERGNIRYVSRFLCMQNAIRACIEIKMF